MVANSSDLLAAGLAKSYASPGGNLTGFTTLTDVMTGKRLEVLYEAVPAVRKVLLLHNPTHPQAAGIEAQTKKVAARLGIQLVVLQAAHRRDIEIALDSLSEIRPDAVLLGSHALFRRHSAMLIEGAMKHGAFVVHWQDYAAAQGALLVVGIDEAKQYHRVAAYVDRILKGARPGDMPIEQVIGDEITVNLATARTLGVKVSQSVLLRASKVLR